MIGQHENNEEQPELFPLAGTDACSSEDSESAPVRPEYRHRQVQRITQCLGHKVATLTVTDNRRNMISWRKLRGGKLNVRLHHMFLDAPPAILQKLRCLLDGDKTAREAIRAYIRSNQHRIRSGHKQADSRPRSCRRLKPVGQKFDLRDIYREVNEKYFASRSTAKVTWGPALSSKDPRNLRFGSYNTESNLITISRRLNAPDIPRNALCYIMFHEILHEMLGVERTESGRRRIHTREFRRRERYFSDLQKVKEFFQQRWNVKI